MKDVLAELTKYPVKTRLNLKGTMIVARDMAHAKIAEIFDKQEKGEALTDIEKTVLEVVSNHPIYYAGPAKTPEGMPTGSFGPTTAGRMDPYVMRFQSKGASMIMVAKGNRSQDVTDACHKYGGFYLGSIGGPAPSAARQQSSPNRTSSPTTSSPSRNSAWKLSARSRSRTSPPSSSWMTRATTSSRISFKKKSRRNNRRDFFI